MEKFTINIEPRELYKPEDEHLICMPDGTHHANPENPPSNVLTGEEMLASDENHIESESDRYRDEGPLDPETGLPQTGINVETGLPIELPEGVDLTDPVTGKSNVMIDPKTMKLDPETHPVIDPNSGMPIMSSLRIEGRSLNSPRGIPTETALRINQLESFVQRNEGPQQFNQGYSNSDRFY